MVVGQRRLQASSDVLLDWSATEGGHQQYWRPIHDNKGSAEVTKMSLYQLESHERVYAWSLAPGHPRSGNSLAINAYRGSGSAFDKAWCRFALAYVDQNENDHQAIADGRI